MQTADRLLSLFGILGVIATQLLVLRDTSRLHSYEMASRHVPLLEIQVIINFYRLTCSPNVKEFWRRVAMLGGVLGRKLDGDPGWQALWTGWLRFTRYVSGNQTY